MHPTDDLTSRGLLAVARALTAPTQPKPTWTDAMRKDALHHSRCNDVIRVLRAMNEVDAGIIAAMEAMD